MLTRCGMLSRALWSRSRASCLLGRSSRRHPNQASFTRPRNNHIALEGYRLTGESKSANPGDPRFPSTHRASNLVLQGSLGGESPAAFRGKVAPSPTCSTWNTWAAGPEGGATRLPLIGRGSPGARRFRSIRLAAHASLDAPACELSQQSGSLVEVNAPTRRRHHRSLRGIRGGARETHVAQPEDAGAPCGQACRGVHSTHGARARSQDLSGSLISRKPGSRLPVDISGSARPGGSAAIGCRVEVNALTRRCLSRSSA